MEPREASVLPTPALALGGAGRGNVNVLVTINS